MWLFMVLCANVTFNHVFSDTMSMKPVLLWTTVLVQVMSASVNIFYIHSGLTVIPNSTDPLCTHLFIQHNFISHILTDNFVSYPNLYNLNLRNNSIISIAERSLNGLNRLKIISLETNRLVQLPVDLGFPVQNLRWLVMWNAMDTGITASFSNPYFSAFTSLEKLDLGKIKHCITFNTEILPRSLTYIRLQGSIISKLPNFSVVSGIEILNLKNNFLVDIPRHAIVALSKLREFNICENQLTSVPDISFMTQLEVLDIGNNRLTTIPDLYDVSLAILRIDDNPLECNHSLCWIRMWPWMKTPMLEGDPKCASPIDIQGTALMELPPTYLGCYNGMPN